MHVSISHIFHFYRCPVGGRGWGLLKLNRWVDICQEGPSTRESPFRQQYTEAHVKCVGFEYINNFPAESGWLSGPTVAQ